MFRVGKAYRKKAVQIVLTITISYRMKLLKILYQGSCKVQHSLKKIPNTLLHPYHHI